MARPLRVDVGDTVYHVLNRANFRSTLFSRRAHYQGFLNIVEEVVRVAPMRLLAYCLMPNHWHFVLYPQHDGDLARFLQRVTVTHTQRYHVQTKTVGYGHIYQGRYKSLPVQQDRYFLALVRYVEGNAKRAGLVKRAEDWPWSSLYVRLQGSNQDKQLLSPWPVEEPPQYITWVNQPEPEAELAGIRHSIKRNRPYGSARWVAATVKRFDLESVMRNPWRPKKGT